MNLLEIFHIVAVFLVGNAEAYRILVVPMHLQASHKKSMVPLADALGRRGHYVKIWNPFFVKQPISSDHVVDDDLVVKTDNVHFLEEFVWKNSSKGIDAWNSVLANPWEFQSLWDLNSHICRLALENHPGVIDTLLAEHWDLIIIDMFFAPCGLILIERSGLPFVSMTTNLIPSSSARHYGMALPQVGTMSSDQNFDGRSFIGRMKVFLNWVVLERIIQDVFVEWEVRKHLNPFVSGGFTYQSLDSRASMVFSTIPDSLDFPRSALPNVFKVGGPKCKTPKKLPDDWLEFVEDPSSNGTILAAFGHVVTWRTVPMHSIMAFHEAFRRLANYRIVWQYDGPQLPKLPNVRLANWLPQTDLLAHPSMELFISHAGLKSTMEGICAKVPFLTIPIYAEQPENSRILIFRHKLGYALDKFDFTAAEIEEKVLKIVTNHDFKKSAIRLAEVVAESPINGLELGAYACEFTIKHQKQLGILQSKVKGLLFFQYYYLDLFMLVVPGSFAIVIIVQSILFLVSYPAEKQP